MKCKMTFGLMIAVCLSAILWAGDLNPSAPPTAGTMKPLDDVEPRTAISSVPIAISTSGSYYLTQNFVCTGSPAITISVDNVKLDMNGFTLQGSGSGAYYGISMSSRTNVEIINGTLRDFVYYGVYATGNSTKNIRLTNLCVFSCGYSGLYIYGIQSAPATGGGHLIRDCTVSQCGTGDADNAMYVGYDSTVKNCIFTNNTGRGLFASSGCVIDGCSFSHNGDVGLNTGYYCTVINNTFTSNLDGGAYMGKGCIVKHNTAANNENSPGIYAYDNSVVEGNTVMGTIDDPATATIVEGHGISTGANCTISGNTVQSNEGSGIRSNSGCSVLNNSVRENNVLDSTSAAGIYAYNENVVRGNHCTSNKQYNIYVTFYRNVIENNSVLGDGTQYGIYFFYSGNFYANNRAANNSTAYGGNVPAGSGDGGGNVSY